ncbi:helix-turn-helix domain-containing protein [Herbiconiux sp. YIM B11900]|uniref:helix-turn-helix domain-containing protein n=1 Tax=Herbiconiux sp. YIM B11900 TaxID=3404131 RepID=UPI003F872B49
MAEGSDLITLGRRIRHHRKEKGYTLDQLGARVGVVGSQLSLIENGRREPKLSLLQSLSGALDVPVTQLLSDEAPDARTALEIELSKAQSSPLYGSLGLPLVPASRNLPLETLESLVGLHRELRRRATESIATPEEARRANTENRMAMRAKNNYLPDLEKLAEETLATVGHTSGALTHRSVSLLAENLGFTLIYVDNLPHSARSVTDLENGRIYLPPASIPGGHGLRSMALQAMAHRLLGHQPPQSYAEFLQQRLEINYFAAACLMPQTASVAFLRAAKQRKDLSVEDFRDAFGVTHEAAALRMTNLGTAHLDMPVHFLRVGKDGAIYKAYENDELPLPVDVTGAVEGQLVCRKWAARGALGRTNRTTEFYQYTDTPAGTYWCATQTGKTDAGEFSITFGVPFSEAKWFRGRDTQGRVQSTCPDESCCRRPDSALADRWSDAAWPSAKLHAHILSPLPSGKFPGVDENEVYQFLESHAEGV